MDMLKKFFQTDDNYASLILRVIAGLVIFPHGAQKLLGWFGGHGFNGTIGFFTDTMGVPAIIAILVILCESLGSLALIAGFATRFMAAGLAMVMIGAVIMVHMGNGFFMNWSGKQGGEGYEYHLLLIGICAALVISGAGKWSVDRWLLPRLPMSGPRPQEI
jgi:putative oxidoreductase